MSEKKEWNLDCTNKNGDMVMLESTMNLSKHKVRLETLERIKKLYY